MEELPETVTPEAAPAKKPEKQTLLYRLTGILTAWLVYPLFNLKIIRGKDTLPETGGAIVASNHIHLADPVFLYYTQKRQIRFMAKAELFDNPVTRALCKGYDAFPVRRGAHDTGALDKAAEILREGDVLGIFPEGTRSKDGNLGRGKSGVSLLAFRSGAPIYPVAVYTKKKPLRPFCRYTIAVGDPVTAQELGVVEGTAQEFRAASAKLMEIIAELREECRLARE